MRPFTKSILPAWKKQTSEPRGGGEVDSPATGRASAVISHPETLALASGLRSSITTPPVGENMASIPLAPTPTYGDFKILYDVKAE